MAATAVESLRKKTNEQCHASLCHDSDCWLTMENAPHPYVLLYLEHETSPVDKGRPHCDFLYVGGGGHSSNEWVAPIELTTGESRVRKFLRQLQPGASLAENLIPDSIEVRFRPIAVHERENTRKSERKRRRNPDFHIEFRERKFPLKFVYCGTALSQALSGS